jgi:hypothetical protein
MMMMMIMQGPVREFPWNPVFMSRELLRGGRRGIGGMKVFLVGPAGRVAGPAG